MDIFNIDAKQRPTDESTIVILFNSLRSINPAYGLITLQLELQGISTFETIVGHLEDAERRLAAMKPAETALRTTDRKPKGNSKLECWHCGKKGHVKVKCQSWLKDTDEGRKHAAEHSNSTKAKTGPLPTPGAKGNLSPEKAQTTRPL
jgi:hypothetical protein